MITPYSNIISVTTLIDPDALAFFQRVTDAGGSLSTTEQDAILTLVADLKANSLWSKMKAVYPMVGASAAACAQNLKSSSFTGTFSSGWTFSSTGVEGNGTSARMFTDLVPNVEFLDEKITFASYVLLNTGGIHISCQPPNTFDWPGVAISVYNSTGVSNPSINTSGFRCITRNNTTQIESKTNNNATLSTSQNFVNKSTGQFTLGSLGTSFYSDHNIRFASIGNNLTIENQEDFYTAVQAFQTTLGRAIAP
jgi:hypothetical protein